MFRISDKLTHILTDVTVVFLKKGVGTVIYNNKMFRNRRQWTVEFVRSTVFSTNENLPCKDITNCRNVT
jgi:hypothetical protein